MGVTGGYNKDGDSCGVLLFPYSCLLERTHEHLENLVFMEH